MQQGAENGFVHQEQGNWASSNNKHLYNIWAATTDLQVYATNK
jgi:hypothetical protein